MNATATAYRDTIDAAAATLHVSRGNAKTGNIPSVSTLPGAGVPRKADGTPLVNESGTCAGCCGACERECYAMRSVRRYRDTARAWAENTAFIRRSAGAFAVELDAWLSRRRNRPAAFRIHTGGEFMPGKAGENELAAWVAVARANPDITFYGYTKRVELLERHAASFPANLRILLSVWHGSDADARTDAPRFVYDDGTDPAVSALPHCPAVGRDGKARRNAKGERITCATCRRCIEAKPGQRIAVHAH